MTTLDFFSSKFAKKFNKLIKLWKNSSATAQYLFIRFQPFFVYNNLDIFKQICSFIAFIRKAAKGVIEIGLQEYFMFYVTGYYRINLEQL